MHDKSLNFLILFNFLLLSKATKLIRKNNIIESSSYVTNYNIYNRIIPDKIFDHLLK